MGISPGVADIGGVADVLHAAKVRMPIDPITDPVVHDGFHQGVDEDAMEGRPHRIMWLGPAEATIGKVVRHHHHRSFGPTNQGLDAVRVTPGGCQRSTMVGHGPVAIPFDASAVIKAGLPCIRLLLVGEWLASHVIAVHLLVVRLRLIGRRHRRIYRRTLDRAADQSR